MSENLLIARPPLYTAADLLDQARLEQAADRLLEADLAAPPAPYSFHSECSLRRRRFRRDVPAPAPARPEDADRPRVLLDLLGRLPLGTRRRLILRLTARGYTRGQIADLLGLSVSRVSALKQSACRSLAEVPAEQRDLLLPPRLALRETYRAELARRGYVAEKHCLPGQEACRRTGQCDRRWYLYFDEDEPPQGER